MEVIDRKILIFVEFLCKRGDTMSINLLEFIKSLPVRSHQNYGVAVGFDTIYRELEHQNGFDNKDVLEMKLIELENVGYLNMHRDINGVITAVSI